MQNKAKSKEEKKKALKSPFLNHGYSHTVIFETWLLSYSDDRRVSFILWKLNVYEDPVLILFENNIQWFTHVIK